MQYEVENISSVRKKIQITVSAEEVNAAIDATFKTFKKNVQLDGFRKGKVPASVIERRFLGEILAETKNNLLSKYTRQLINELKAKPLDAIKIEETEEEIVKNQPYIYAIEFEELPKFEIPNYDGLEIRQTKVIDDPAQINKLVEQIREEFAEWKDVTDQLLAKNGNKVEIDFEGYENGSPIKALNAKNFILKLGSNESVPDFENLIKTIEKGKSGVGEVSFPEDFQFPNVAGKTIEMHITVNSIQEPMLPELNDDFAKNLSFNNLNEFYDFIKNEYAQKMEYENKVIAQNQLLDQLIKQTSFDLPPSMVDWEVRYQMLNIAFSLTQQGYDIRSMKKPLEEIKNHILPEAEEVVRRQVLLRVIAEKEKLMASEQEILNSIFEISLKNGQDFKTVLRHFEESGEWIKLKERLLADKAMDLIYSKAKIEYVETPDSEENSVKGI